MSTQLFGSEREWAPWTNQRIILYHGTTISSARAILRDGVDLRLGRQTVDFGRGFCTTTSHAAAQRWSIRVAARSREEPAILRVLLDRLALSRLASIVFVRGSLSADDYWSFVSHCRSGGEHLPDGGYYDVAYGPVARLWQNHPRSAILEGHDQISFHTAAARDMLNGRDVCTVEEIA